MKIDYKIQDKIDFAILVPAFLLAISGLIAVYSSTINHPTANGNFDRQFIFLLLSVAAVIIIYFLPILTFRWITIVFYVISIFFLVLVLIMGKTVYGAKSWLSFGLIGFQPSELAKLGTILLLALWLSNRKQDINNIFDLGVSLSIGLLPVFLILLEPDMGTAIVFIAIIISMLFWAGINLFALFVVISPGVMIFMSLFGWLGLAGGLLLVITSLLLFRRNIFTSLTVFVVNLSSAFFFEFIFRLLKPHQQQRIDSFLNPDLDPLGNGYNALQAKVAVGSGGLIGKGFMQGNQTQLRFIPEQWTDFIFCVIGEEFGFIGSLIIIGLYILLLYRLLKLAHTVKDKFSGLIISGMIGLFFSHFAINIGMNIGIAPVIGLPLPFISYGGSSLLINMALIGLALNIYRNRKQYV
ncbi:MAG: rod shape-determining protein RodA [Ignavibacteriales bacterium]|nr:rod shape-determining protein RodA [Ignavibacteriales bacterium]MCF8314917.1 rod shape-determining protein RodA [Ignavibacteriales bacterium]MCF8436134.1 rod shape-determining protein RodA [Ignavibacteriales bacterium]